MAKNRFEEFLFGMDVYRSKFTKAEMMKFLNRVRTHVDNDADFERHAEASALLIALNACQLRATTDSAANAMRRGYYLGLCVVAYDGRIIYEAVQAEIQAEGIKTRAKGIFTRNNNLVADYRRLEAKQGCLPTRRLLKSEYKLTLTRINQILKGKGITINRKR